MCGSGGQREGLSSLRSVKGQDFKQTSQISFQLNLFDSVSLINLFQTYLWFYCQKPGFLQSDY